MGFDIMLRNLLTLSVALIISALFCADANAQFRLGGHLGGLGGFGGQIRGKLIRPNGAGAIFDGDGLAQATSQHVGPKARLRSAPLDRFSPRKLSSYSNAGLAAQHSHAWNKSEQNVYSWHGEYANPQWGTPLAVVVPPTAGYQSSYAWGVGQTRSTPIHHQFGRGNDAAIGGGNGSHLLNPPFNPSSTDQFGAYPVRGPW